MSKFIVLIAFTMGLVSCSRSSEPKNGSDADPTILRIEDTGGSDGGGGKGVVCREADGTVKSVELLDLWEARTIYGRQVLPLTGDFETAFRAAAKRLQNVRFSVSEITGQEDIWFRTAQSLLLTRHSAAVHHMRGVSLTLTEDSYEDVRPLETSFCKVEQIVNFKSAPNFTYVNDDLFEKMDLANQVALGLHEVYYNDLREYFGEKNSLRTRRAVGYVMTGGEFKPDYHLFNKPYIECSNRNYSPYWFYQSSLYFATDESGLIVAIPSMISTEAGDFQIQSMDPQWTGGDITMEEFLLKLKAGMEIEFKPSMTSWENGQSVPKMSVEAGTVVTLKTASGGSGVLSLTKSAGGQAARETKVGCQLMPARP